MKWHFPRLSLINKEKMSERMTCDMLCPFRLIKEKNKIWSWWRRDVSEFSSSRNVEKWGIYHFGPLPLWSKICHHNILVQKHVNSMYVLVFLPLTVFYNFLSLGPKWYRNKMRYCHNILFKNIRKMCFNYLKIQIISTFF